MRLTALRPALALIVTAALAPSGWAAPPPPPRETPRPVQVAPVPPGVPSTADNVHWPTEGEVRMGREVAAQVERAYAVITSGPQYDRLQRVATELQRAVQEPRIAAEYRRVYNLPKPSDRSRRVPFEYRFKLIEAREINAFCLAGGPVYVTRGLMDYTPSDDELAAVLSHEVTHAAFHHLEKLGQKQKKNSAATLGLFAAALLAGIAGAGQAASAAFAVAQATSLLSIAAMSGYSRELEAEADRVGVMTLRTTRYNPVGMLTFMQKLMREDRLRGNPDGGIFQSHPYTDERVASIKSELERFGYRTDPGEQRKVSGAFRVQIVPYEWQGRPVTELRLNEKVLFTVVAAEERLSQADRARKIATQIDELLIANVSDNEVRKSQDRTQLLIRGIPVIQVFTEDALITGSPTAAIDQAYKTLIQAFWKERLDMGQ